MGAVDKTVVVVGRFIRSREAGRELGAKNPKSIAMRLVSAVPHPTAMEGGGGGSARSDSWRVVELELLT